MMFNEKLLELRKEKGLSQEELGEKLGVTRQTVSKWELGSTSPKLDDLVKISNFFEISVDELIGNEEKIKNDDKDNLNVNYKNNSNPKKKILLLLLVIIISIYFIYCIYKFFVILKIEKMSNKIWNDLEIVYGLSYSNTSTDGNISEWKDILYNGNEIELLNTLDTKYTKVTYIYDETGQNCLKTIYKIYDIENKTYTTKEYEGYNGEIYEKLHFSGELLSEVNANITPIINTKNIDSKTIFFRRLKISINPLVKIESNEDAYVISKGKMDGEENVYAYIVDKTNNRISYIRHIVNQDNRADCDTVSISLYPKEEFERVINQYNFDEYTLVQE